MPALLTRTSIRPCAATMRSSVMRHSDSSRTSSRKYAARSPSSSATARPCLSLMSARSTCAPSAANARAMASPMPRAAPVTSAIFPCKRFIWNPYVLDLRPSGDGIMTPKDTWSGSPGFLQNHQCNPPEHDRAGHDQPRAERLGEQPDAGDRGDHGYAQLGHGGARCPDML